MSATSNKKNPSRAKLSGMKNIDTKNITIIDIIYRRSYKTKKQATYININI